MKVSLNWLKKFTDVDLSVDELVEKIGAQLGAVDEVIELGKKYEGIVVVEVLSCEKHPDADKLSVCMVDDRGAVAGVNRQADGHVQIVCGAPNVKAGMLAAWVPPGTVVPSTIDKDPFTIEAKEIRGIVSNGMLASPKELALGDSHEGLLEIEAEIEPGKSFAEVYELNDTIIDIENKMFTHRPDCFGILGVAREIAGIQGKQFTSPDWYRADATPAQPQTDVLNFAVKNEVSKLVPRFCVLVMKDVKVGPSPGWMQASLTRVGVRPINNIVDITNYLMIETGQPLHAYDYDKLSGSLEVRMASDGEEIVLLGGKTIKMSPENIVIASAGKPVGLGGVLGGAESEVDENTKNIVLECGNFDMNTTRRSSMQHGLFTDASIRFTKGQSPLQNSAVITKATETVQEIAGGKIASELFDSSKDLPQPASVRLDADFINKRLGLELKAEDIAGLLRNVEFSVNIDEHLAIQSPFWRTDVSIPEDIVEEVGRLYGYDKLSAKLPTKDLSPANLDSLIEFKNRLRDILSSGGANEILTYSFVHGSLLQKAGQASDMAYELKNALSPDLQYYRLSVMPSVLEKLHPNIKLGYGRFALFELGKSHNKKYPDDNGEKVPKEFNMLALAVAANAKGYPANPGSAFYWARTYLDYLADKLGIHFKYEALTDAPDYPVAKPYDFSRSAVVSVAETGVGVGMVGEFRPEVSAALKLPAFCAGFEVGVEELLAGLPDGSIYKPLSRFPKVQQDITLKTPGSVSFAQLKAVLKEALEEQKPPESYVQLEALDIYQKDADQKHVSFRLQIFSYKKTLKAEEVNSLLDILAKQTMQKLGAERV